MLRSIKYLSTESRVGSGKNATIQRSRFIRFLVIATFSLMVLTPLTLVSGFATEVTLTHCSGTTVISGQGVDFEQVDFVFTNITQENSDWGRLNVDPVLLSSSTGISKGYLNVFTDAGWVIQNLPIDFSDGLAAVTTYFGFGLCEPKDITTLWAHVEFSPCPEIHFFDGARSNFAVGVALWNAEGFGTSHTSAIGAAPPPNMVQFNPRGRTETHTQPNAVNVQTAMNQCFPMSIANSLQYLKDRFGLNVPHDHKPGLKGDNTLVGQLDTESNRTATARNNGSGIHVVPMLRGKFSYLDKNGLKDKLVQKHQGRGFGNPPNQALPNGDFTSSGITSKDNGARVTFDWLCNEIKKGEDVELCFSYDNLQGIPTGGHAVRVFECGRTNGAPWIGYLHDRLQTNQDPMDTLGLENVRVYVRDIDGDRLLNLGSRDREIRFALSESKK